MANTYSQIYIHGVFAVKFREHLLQKPWRDELFQYMAGILKNKGQIPLIVNGVTDHVHLLFIMRPSICLSDLIRDVKNHSTNFITDNQFVKGRFRWQEGFGAFSCSKNHAENASRYIQNQENHHRKKKFRDEYLKLLQTYEIVYDEKYLFEWIG